MEQKHILFVVSPMITFIATVVEELDEFRVKIKNPISLSLDLHSGNVVSGYGLSAAHMIAFDFEEVLNLNGVLSFTMDPPKEIVDTYEDSLEKIKAKVAGIEVPEISAPSNLLLENDMKSSNAMPGKASSGPSKIIKL